MTPESATEGPRDVGTCEGLTLYCDPAFDSRYLPRRSSKVRPDWKAGDGNLGIARYCLPMLMANGLGLEIPSPAGFQIEWDGHSAVRLNITSCAPHASVTARVLEGGFEILPGFVPVTSREGEWVYIKGVPNLIRSSFTCLEGVIESWWNPSPFPLVFFLNQPGTFEIEAGQPIAQMFVFSAPRDEFAVRVHRGYPEEYETWKARRFRPTYNKPDRDYMQGRHPDGTTQPGHLTSWPRVRFFGEAGGSEK